MRLAAWDIEAPTSARTFAFVQDEGLASSVGERENVCHGISLVQGAEVVLIRVEDHGCCRARGLLSLAFGRSNFSALALTGGVGASSFAVAAGAASEPPWLQAVKPNSSAARDNVVMEKRMIVCCCFGKNKNQVKRSCVQDSPH